MRFNMSVREFVTMARVPCLFVAMALMQCMNSGAQAESRDLQIESIVGAGKETLAPIPNQLVVRLSSSRKVVRCGILITPLTKAAGVDLVSWSGTWKPIHRGEPQMWKDGNGYYEIGPIKLPGRPGTGTFLVQAVAEFAPDKVSGFRPALLYTEPRVIRATVLGEPPEWAVGDAFGDDDPVPSEQVLAGDWIASKLYPGHVLREGVVLGRSLFAMVGEKLLVRIDLTTMWQERSLEMPRRVAEMKLAGDRLVLRFEAPNALVVVDQKTLVAGAEVPIPEGKVGAFSVAAKAPVASVLLSDPVLLKRFDFGSGKHHQWSAKDVDSLESPESLALSVDGSACFLFSKGALHRMRFAGEKLSTEESTPTFAGQVLSRQVMSLSRHGIVAVNASAKSLAGFPGVRGFNKETLLLFKPGDLSKPIGTLPFWSRVFDVDDELGLIVNGTPKGITVSRGTLLPCAEVGFGIQGDAAHKERMVSSHETLGRFSGDKQVLSLGPKDRRIFVVGNKGSFLLTPPAWVYADGLDASGARWAKTKANSPPIKSRPVPTPIISGKPHPELRKIKMSLEGKGAGDGMQVTVSGFYAFLYEAGFVTRIDLKRGDETHRLPLGFAVHRLGMTAYGLAIYSHELHELWLVEPASLRVKNRIGIAFEKGELIDFDASKKWITGQLPEYLGNHPIRIDPLSGDYEIGE